MKKYKITWEWPDRIATAKVHSENSQQMVSLVMAFNQTEARKKFKAESNLEVKIISCEPIKPIKVKP